MENAFGQPQSVVVLGGSSDIARAITNSNLTKTAIAGSDPNAEKAAMNREIADRVDHAVAELPREQREVFRRQAYLPSQFGLAFFEGQTVETR